MFKADLRLGEFRQAVNGLLDFEPKETLSRSSYFGLQLNECWLMAHLREAGSGRQLHVVRPMALETGAGMSFSNPQQGCGVALEVWVQVTYIPSRGEG